MSEHYTVIPHGCATLVYSCDCKEIHCNLFGPMTKPSCVGHEANSADMLFIIEFMPAGYYAFSEIPQDELTNLLIPAELLAHSYIKDIEHLLEDAGDIESLIQAVDNVLLSHLQMHLFPQEFLTANALILQGNGMKSVSELSQEVYYSERHLSRIFNKYIGASTKTYSRLVRVNKILSLMRQRDISIIRTGIDGGFYDESHFIHDFSSICGITPKKYQDNMSDFYSELAKF